MICFRWLKVFSSIFGMVWTAAIFEVAPRIQHLTWITLSSHQSTTGALETVWHKERYHRNKLAELDTGERLRPLRHVPVHGVGLIDVHSLSLNLTRIGELTDITQLPDDSAGAQWHFTDPTVLPPLDLTAVLIDINMLVVIVRRRLPNNDWGSTDYWRAKWQIVRRRLQLFA